jgi:cobalt transporter subunit CbtA
VNEFRKLMVTVFASGVLAGLALFTVQYFTVVPLIQAAETHEAAEHEAHAVASDEDEGWQPTESWERTSLTALTTLLTGIAFAAFLFGMIALTGKTINTRQGGLWGLAAFACFSLAPALGLPPQPPGVAVADLHQRQLWWAGTVISTAVGREISHWARLIKRVHSGAGSPTLGAGEQFLL